MREARTRAWRPLHAVALFLGLLSLAGLLVALNILAIGQNEEDLEMRNSLAETLQRKIKTTLSAASAGGPAQQTQSALLVGETETIAAAALQSLVNEAIQSQGVEIGSAELTTDTIPDDPATSLRAINLTVTFDAKIREFQSILVLLESARPALQVDGLQLAPMREEVGTLESDPPLHAFVQLRGYWRPQ